jgi:hypothetical protein
VYSLHNLEMKGVEDVEGAFRLSAAVNKNLQSKWPIIGL